jgi:hypothetical protein
MKKQPFDRAKHVYRNDEFAEMVKDAIRFLNGTPVRSIPPSESFFGAGVYAFYYTGDHPPYAEVKKRNRLEYSCPIYVGKAVPRGWRQSRVSGIAAGQGRELHSRIREHSRTIDIADSLSLDDFKCRFVIFEDIASDMIGTVEAALIKLKQPLWNTTVDGFGNHTPGKGRFGQAKSDWDVIHPGRAWAEKCRGVHKTKAEIRKAISQHWEETE